MTLELEKLSSKQIIMIAMVVVVCPVVPLAMGVAHGVITDNKAESLIDVIAMVSLVVLGSIAFAKFLSHHIAKVYVYDLREILQKNGNEIDEDYLEELLQSKDEYWGTKFAAQYTAMHAAIHRHKNMNSPPLSTKFNKKKKRLGVSKKSRAHLLAKQKSIQ